LQRATRVCISFPARSARLHLHSALSALIIFTGAQRTSTPSQRAERAHHLYLRAAHAFKSSQRAKRAYHLYRRAQRAFTPRSALSTLLVFTGALCACIFFAER
jgi:hypothetical protein